MEDSVEGAVEKMEAQLKLWGVKIHELAAKTEKAGAHTRFDALVHIDELKALHAIAQSKLDDYKAAGDTEKPRLESEMRSAWDELDAAFRMPRRA
jgi:hypothetical protein